MIADRSAARAGSLVAISDILRELDAATRGRLKKITRVSGLVLSNRKACTRAAACDEVYLSDICPLYEFGVHFCLRFDSVYWQSNIVIDGTTYAKGLGLHPPHPNDVPDVSCRFHRAQTPQPGRGSAAWSLKGYDRFSATIGLAEENGMETTTGANGGRYRVYVDGNLRFESPIFDYTTPPAEVVVDSNGGSTLVLEVDALGDNHADATVWANARLRRTCP